MQHDIPWLESKIDSLRGDTGLTRQAMAKIVAKGYAEHLEARGNTVQTDDPRAPCDEPPVHEPEAKRLSIEEELKASEDKRDRQFDLYRDEKSQIDMVRYCIDHFDLPDKQLTFLQAVANIQPVTSRQVAALSIATAMMLK